MQTTHDHRFDAPVDEVARMLADPAFLHRRARAAGADSEDVVVDGDASGAFTVAIRRTVPASSIPTEFRGFVGRDLQVTYTEAWEGPEPGGRRGTFAVEIAGAPGHMAGELTLLAEEEATTFAARGNVHVTMPLFGAVIERAVADAVDKALTAELAAADAWLAER